MHADAFGGNTDAENRLKFRLTDSGKTPRAAAPAGRLEFFHEGFAERRQQAREGNRTTVFGPRLAVHPHPKLPARRKRDAHQQDFEIFLVATVLDRNSQICFHNTMVAAELTKSTVHNHVHGC